MTKQRNWLGPNPLNAERDMISVQRSVTDYAHADIQSRRQLAAFSVLRNTVRVSRFLSVQDVIDCFVPVSQTCCKFLAQKSMWGHEHSFDVLNAGNAADLINKNAAAFADFQKPYMESFAELILKPIRRRRKTQRGMQGDEFDIHAMQSGRYDRAWVKTQRVKREDFQGDICIAFNNTINANTRCESLHITGAVINTVMESCKNRSIRVRCMMFGQSIRTTGDAKRHNVYTVPVFPQDIARVFTVAYNRSIGFAGQCTTGFTRYASGLGRAVNWRDWRKIRSGSGYDAYDEDVAATALLAVTGREIDNFAEGGRVIVIPVLESKAAAKAWIEKFNREML